MKISTSILSLRETLTAAIKIDTLLGRSTNKPKPTSRNDNLKGGSDNDAIKGLAGNDTISGETGDDTLRGGSGNDSLDGGDGKDTLSGESGDDTLQGRNGDDSLDGGGGDDILYGEKGNDTLGGGTGADSLTGGAGDDRYFVDNIKDKITETADGGAKDTVYNSSINYYTLPEYVEDLRLQGARPLQATGNPHNNVIFGNMASNTLNGGGGDDTLKGGEGDDELNGGDGNDMALYSGEQADYKVTWKEENNQRVWTIEDINQNDGLDEGTDTLKGIEQPRFNSGAYSDDKINLSISDVEIPEDFNRGTPVKLTVTLLGQSSKPVVVDYQTENDTAEAGSDYTSIKGRITFNPGETEQKIFVTVLADTRSEGDESFRVNFNPVQALSGTTSSARVTLTNDDAPPPSLYILGSTIPEGDTDSRITALVRLSQKSDQPVDVQYTTQNGSALEGVDYTASSGRLRFEPGEIKQEISVPILGDTKFEPDENFRIQLDSAINANLDPTSSGATFTLNNDDKRSTDQDYPSEIDLGSADGKLIGKLIKPVQVDGDHLFYYWDRSGDGTSAQKDYFKPDDLDELFQQDVNGRVEGKDGAPVVGEEGRTDNTYRYAQLNGIKLALPTIGAQTDTGYFNGTPIGSNPADTGSPNDNPTYDDYLAIWDAYNGTGVARETEGMPKDWASASYWAATSEGDEHALIRLNTGYVYFDSFNLGYVAVEVL